jgi:1-phosphatidylinositol phosphodiesterase
MGFLPRFRIPHFILNATPRSRINQTMSNEPITLRNITSQPIAVKLIERFAPPDTGFQPDIANITKTFSSLLNNVTRADVPKLDENAKPFDHRELDIRVDPFKTVRTDLPGHINDPKERIRLTIECNGERHTLDAPCPTNESMTLTSQSPNPKYTFTGVFIPKSSHLSIYSSANLDSWMREHKDSTLLSSLSIPGTHNSPTCHLAPPSVRCQAVSPREQLENGVRFFDLRVQPAKPEDPGNADLILVHSVFPISLTGNKYFKDLLAETYSFLEAHPSETVIFSLKREGTGNATDQQLARLLKTHYTNPQQWFTQPRIPKLGEARKKIVLIRRFGLDDGLAHEWGGKGWGINAENWADNTPCATCSSGLITVQDFYEVMEEASINQKISYATGLLSKSGVCTYDPEAHEDHKQPFFINFLSGSNFWNVDCWPEKIAQKVNPAVVEWICCKHCEQDGDWGTGIVVCDWVGLEGDWDLVRCIVGMNAKLLLKNE